MLIDVGKINSFGLLFYDKFRPDFKQGSHMFMTSSSETSMVWDSALKLEIVMRCGYI